jgi:hypothetical protein
MIHLFHGKIESNHHPLYRRYLANTVLMNLVHCSVYKSERTVLARRQWLLLLYLHVTSIVLIDQMYMMYSAVQSMAEVEPDDLI